VDAELVAGVDRYGYSSGGGAKVADDVWCVVGSGSYEAVSVGSQCKLEVD